MSCVFYGESICFSVGHIGSSDSQGSQARQNDCGQGDDAEPSLCHVQLVSHRGTAKDGKFWHLPIVEHGEVIAMLDISKFLCDQFQEWKRQQNKAVL